MPTVGSIQKFKKIFGTVTERFWARITKTDNCWTWNGATDTSGYGLLEVENKTRAVHRLSWELHYGSIPNGLGVFHKCDNRICIRPSHLFIGTARDNVADRDRKGRQAIGKRNARTKLMPTQIRQIRELFVKGVSYSALGRKFSVDAKTIWCVINGKSWKYVV